MWESKQMSLNQLINENIHPVSEMNLRTFYDGGKAYKGWEEKLSLET